MFPKISSRKIEKREFVYNHAFEAHYLTPKGRVRVMTPEMHRLATVLLQEFLGGPANCKINYGGAVDVNELADHQIDDLNPKLLVDLNLINLLTQR